jgi:hypothetical protein
LFFVLPTALLTAAVTRSFVVATAATPPAAEGRVTDIGVPNSKPTSPRLPVESAQLSEAHQKNSLSRADRCRSGDQAMGQRPVRGFRDVGIVLNGKIPMRWRRTRLGILRPS